MSYRINNNELDLGDISIVTINGLKGIDKSIITRVVGINVITIEKKAFFQWTELQSVDFPNLTTIGVQAFEKCSSLISVDFPLVTIMVEESSGSNAFWDCTALQTVKFNNLPIIGERTNPPDKATVLYRENNLIGGPSIWPDIWRCTQC